MAREPARQRVWGLLTRGFSTLAGGTCSRFLPRHPPQPARPVSASQTTSANGSLYFPDTLPQKKPATLLRGGCKSSGRVMQACAVPETQLHLCPRHSCPHSPQHCRAPFPLHGQPPGTQPSTFCTISNRMGDAAVIWHRRLPRGNFIILFLIELQCQHRAQKGGGCGQAI